MQKNIFLKVIDGKVNIIVDNKITFEQFLEAFKLRLDSIYIKRKFLENNLVIDFQDRELCSKDILKIFDVLSSFENILVDKIKYKEKNNKNVTFHKGNIRSGENKLFTTNTLIIGNINRGSRVVINGDLYVIGRVNGNIEFKNINNSLTCSYINKSYIKISSFEKYIDDSYENSVIKLKDKAITIENFEEERGRIYGKSNCSYIW